MHAAPQCNGVHAGPIGWLGAVDLTPSGQSQALAMPLACVRRAERMQGSVRTGAHAERDTQSEWLICDRCPAKVGSETTQAAAGFCAMVLR